MSGVLFVIIALACYRVTHFVTSDLFPPIKRLRNAIIERAGAESAWAYLVECQWCVGVYVSAGAVGWYDHVHGVPVPVFWWLAASGVVGFLSAVEPD